MHERPARCSLQYPVVPGAPGGRGCQAGECVRRLTRWKTWLAGAAEKKAAGAFGASSGGGERAKSKKMRLDELCVQQQPQHSRNVIQSWIQQGACVRVLSPPAQRAGPWAGLCPHRRAGRAVAGL